MTETSSHHDNHSAFQFSLVSSAAVLDGIKLSSVIVPTGVVIHQVRNVLKPAVPVSTSSQANIAPSSTGSSSSLSFMKPSSLNHQLTHFLKLNGLWTFGLGFAYAAATTSFSAFTHHHTFFPGSNKLNKKDKILKYRSNDYSIIGGTLGGLITTTIFWHRSFVNLAKIIPGGIAIGVATGLSTAYVQAIQSNIDDTK